MRSEAPKERVCLPAEGKFVDRLAATRGDRVSRPARLAADGDVLVGPVAADRVTEGSGRAEGDLAAVDGGLAVGRRVGVTHTGFLLGRFDVAAVFVDRRDHLVAAAVGQMDSGGMADGLVGAGGRSCGREALVI